MDYLSYKAFHIVSIVILFISFGFLVATSVGGSSPQLKKWSLISHGVSWVLVLISAFGLVGALGLEKDFPNWAKGKFFVWILLGAMVYPIKKRPTWTFFNLTLAPVLGSIAITLVVFKPDLKFLSILL
jgi:uncharacterized membrane protein SirB2